MASDTAPCEHAIFTSMPGPMGRGYRVVAASGGLSSDEKRQITQCAPSHGNLCADSAAGEGFASFTLRSGRQCIFITRNAGAEHSARGGARVHTHALVIDAGTFAHFGCNPLAVRNAAWPQIDEQWWTQPPSRLECTALPRDAGVLSTPPLCEPAPLAALLDGVLNARRLLIAQTPDVEAAIHWTMRLTPAAFRAGISIASGMKPSPARPFQLVFAEASRADVERATFGQDVTTLTWRDVSDVQDSAFNLWMLHVRTALNSDRPRPLAELCDRLKEERSPDTLAQVARVYADRARAAIIRPEQLEDLLERYADVEPVSKVHGELLRELRTIARERLPAPAVDDGAS